MTVTEYGFETASADHGALSLLAGGDDLFDLTQLAAIAETVPAHSAIAMETGTSSGLAVADHFLSASHGQALPAHLLVASNDPVDAAGQLAAKPGQETTQDNTMAIHDPEDTALAHLQHPAEPVALAAADIFADTGGDLASFQTAAGGSHAPMGSGIFTPFNPQPLLDGLHAMAVLAHA
ncbi:hypothetical protein ACFPL7_02895 [Dongia soli]|uniref:Uncharacterized protein n=1 Tax=Dongia soli TaxID=600628 RepID=A0ABU5EH93_9PROT|nr:hypothetical protein [Dongia soli]MDY0885736.1 hypothetical protein [Dongia soli]